uniref:F-box protein At5g03100-like n=1 Tax=Erigeron canadensis TaxID=72917 RepID=UPI001CB914DC|nr:F-box protein At5g03100-like [Erigeron canadensis]
MKYTEGNTVKQQAIDEELLVNGTKGKKKVGDSGMEEDDECPGPTMIDFISQMPDDILVKILSLLPLKNAVITGILSKRWRFVWPYLKRLDFDGSDALDEMDEKLCVVEEAKYINQVNNVIRSHVSPTLQFFRIRFNLDKTYSKDIDDWIRYAFDKKVELLELNLFERHHKPRDTKDNYDLPLPLLEGSMVHLSEWPSSSSMVVETLSLKKLLLMRVNVSEPSLIGWLKNSPRLETLYLYGSGLMTKVNVGGRDINLKHFMLMGWAELQSISLCDFDLEKFMYIGREIEISLTNLSKLKELDIGQVSVGLNNKVFSMISCVASTLEILSLDIDRQKEDIPINVPGFPVLPNVKTLNLTLPTELDDTIIEYIEIGKKCRSLETFTISLHWCAPITKKKTCSNIFGHCFKHVKISGYRGIRSDVQIALYMIGNAENITIDPSCHPYDLIELSESEAMKREEAGRSHAKLKLSSRVFHPQVKLVVL